MCEKCLYKKNCQFLATHKKVDVEGCTAFESEDEFKAKVRKEFAERLKKRMGFCDLPNGVVRDHIDLLLTEMG